MRESRLGEGVRGRRTASPPFGVGGSLPSEAFMTRYARQPPACDSAQAQMCPLPPACDSALSIQEGEEDVAAASAMGRAASGRRGKSPWRRAGARRAAGGG